jgi:hypothetical protein
LYPSQFCLQPDGKFTVHAVGGDGAGPNDADIMVICSQNLGSQRVFIDNGDNLDYFASFGCYPDTLLYDVDV